MANCLRVALFDGKNILLISLPIVCKNSVTNFSSFLGTYEASLVKKRHRFMNLRSIMISRDGIMLEDMSNSSNQLQRAQTVIEYGLAVVIPSLFACMLFSYVLIQELFNVFFALSIIAAAMLMIPAITSANKKYLCSVDGDLDSLNIHNDCCIGKVKCRITRIENLQQTASGVELLPQVLSAANRTVFAVLHIFHSSTGKAAILFFIRC